MTIWRRLLSVVRWWLGTTWGLIGVGGVAAGPIMILLGNWGGVYMIIGGTEMAIVGWLVHPLGFAVRRHRQRRASAV